MIYIGAPFSHADPEIRRWRYEQVSKFTVELIKIGYVVFSPLTYSFELTERFGLSGTWVFWEAFDIEFLRRCNKLWVYKLPGWEDSVGLRAEIAFAEQNGIPITYLEADDY